MRIVHESGARSFGHGETQYKATKEGVFDVPEEVGRDLVRRAGWSEWTGDDPVITRDQRIAELEAQLQNERAELAKFRESGPRK